MPLKVEYISIMHAAQKLAGLAGLERTTDYVARLAEFDPDIIDKFDSDQAVDIHAEITGISSTIVVPDDIVAEVREERAEAQRKAEEAQQMKEQAGAAKDLAAIDMEKDSALSELSKRSEAGNPLQ